MFDFLSVGKSFGEVSVKEETVSTSSFGHPITSIGRQEFYHYIRVCAHLSVYSPSFYCGRVFSVSNIAVAHLSALHEDLRPC